MKYIKITMNGSGRISQSSSPVEIAGLYTDGIESCVAIILIGKENISLIHDSGYLNLTGEHSIESEFKFTQPDDIYICFNMSLFTSLPEIQQSSIMDHVYRIRDYANRLNMKPRIIPAESYFGISRNGKLLEKKPDISDLIIFPKTKLRERLIEVNYFFTGKNKTVAVDLQYNISNFTALPPLHKDPDSIINLLKNENDFYYKNDQDPNFLILSKSLANYFLLYNGKYEQVLDTGSPQEETRILLDLLVDKYDSPLVKLILEVNPIWEFYVNSKLVIKDATLEPDNEAPITVQSMSKTQNTAGAASATSHPDKANETTIGDSAFENAFKKNFKRQQQKDASKIEKPPSHAKSTSP